MISLLSSDKEMAEKSIVFTAQLGIQSTNVIERNEPEVLVLTHICTLTYKYTSM